MQQKAALQKRHHIFAYLDVLNEPASSLLTMYNVFGSLKANEHIWEESKKLLVVGDAKTYFHIASLVSTYPEEFENMPFPGDWHLLKNFQPVLMKVFFDAGLKQLAETSGYRGETLTSLGTCFNFKRPLAAT